jgi:hypothetical protein
MAHHEGLARAALGSLVAWVVRFLRAVVQDQRIEAEVSAQRSCDLCVATEVGLSADDLYWDLFSDAVEVLDEKAFV